MRLTNITRQTARQSHSCLEHFFFRETTGSSHEFMPDSVFKGFFENARCSLQHEVLRGSQFVRTPETLFSNNRDELVERRNILNQGNTHQHTWSVSRVAIFA